MDIDVVSLGDADDQPGDGFPGGRRLDPIADDAVISRATHGRSGRSS